MKPILMLLLLGGMSFAQCDTIVQDGYPIPSDVKHWCQQENSEYKDTVLSHLPCGAPFGCYGNNCESYSQFPLCRVVKIKAVWHPDRPNRYSNNDGHYTCAKGWRLEPDGSPLLGGDIPIWCVKMEHP